MRHEGGTVKRYEVFVVAVLANIVAQLAYDYCKRQMKTNHLDY